MAKPSVWDESYGLQEAFRQVISSWMPEERRLSASLKGTYDSSMTQPVFVHMLPRFLEADTLHGGIAVVIDILRASTTIVHALANGAKEVVPCETIDEARSIKGSWAERLHDPSKGGVLLGGERKGERIEGFDLGNSPLAYRPEIVAGRTIVFTTTNGTHALRQCTSAARVLIGAFVNRAALTGVLQQDGRPVHLVCAGTDGHLTAEDILFAGAIAADLAGSRMKASAVPRSGDTETDVSVEERNSTDVQTQMAIDYFLARSADQATFQETIRTSRGGQNLLRLGMNADIERASQGDLFDVVPEWHPNENRIVPVCQT